MTEFQSFAKIPRLSRDIVVTEKIDGTNSQIYIGASDTLGTEDILVYGDAELGVMTMKAGSRSRWVTPNNDNFGFATWVRDNAEELARLGPGHHYGEWWGKGIQRGYGLNERRFSLFNTERWGGVNQVLRPACCDVVPIVYQGLLSITSIDACLEALKTWGSLAAPGFMQPEGVVVFHTASGHLYKKTCEHDDEPKNAHVKKQHAPHSYKPRPKGGDIGGRRKSLTPGYLGPERRAHCMIEAYLAGAT